MTETIQITAESYKAQGNKALVASHFDEAIALYTKAIELDSTKEVYYANRAQAYIKNESYGLAIADATKAIEINPNYVKSYYRRAVANTAIIKHKEALKDFRAVVEKSPGDKDAKSRYEECQRILRRIAFEKAIAQEEGPSILDSLNLKNLTVDDSYDGAELDISFDDSGAATTKMSVEFVQDMIERFKSGKLLHKKYVFAIISEAIKIFRQEPTMPQVRVNEGEKLTVCGDTHGQYFDLLEIFNRNGYPSKTQKYVFNGDFVDRGSWSTEVALLLFSYKLLYPGSFFINRGNHEADSMNKVYGFEGECKHKYNEKVFKVFSESFATLPLAVLIGKSDKLGKEWQRETLNGSSNDPRYLVLHGGLFSNDSTNLEDIRALNRFQYKQPDQSKLMMEMLWTDPQSEPGRGPSKRGVGIQFGPDVTKSFCQANGITAVIRSHEMRMDGYELEHEGRLITVFSAPNYCDFQGNKGAYINIGPDYLLNFNQFDAVPHPNVKPMAYASNLV